MDKRHTKSVKYAQAVHSENGECVVLSENDHSSGVNEERDA